MPDVVIDVRVIPRAKRSEFAGERDGALVVRLAAPPVEGSANQALIVFLAEALDVPRRNIRILSGERSRHKRIAIAGIEIERVKALAGRR